MCCQLYECKYNDHGTCMAYREGDEKYSCETKVKAPMLRFMLDGCDISYAAEAPADMTLAQLLKQCDRIHADYCACGIRSTDEEPELIFGYNSVDYVRGENGYAECSIDGVNKPECQYCKYLVKATEEGWIGKCGNRNSRFYNCLRDEYNTCEWQEDKNNEH